MGVSARQMSVGGPHQRERRLNFLRHLAQPRDLAHRKRPAVHGVFKLVKLVEKLAIVAGLASFEQCLCRSASFGAIMAQLH